MDNNENKRVDLQESVVLAMVSVAGLIAVAAAGGGLSSLLASKPSGPADGDAVGGTTIVIETTIELQNHGTKRIESRAEVRESLDRDESSSPGTSVPQSSR